MLQEKILKNTGLELNQKQKLRRRHRTPAKGPIRVVPPDEIEFMRFLWRWKVASFPLVKELFFKKIAWWTFYKKVRRLKAEGLIMERRGSNLDVVVLQLSKKGFEFLKYDFGELRADRFAAQSVTHDYWAMAFQIGEFAISPNSGVEFFTEQEIQCTDESLFPEWVSRYREHIPDGITRIESGKTQSVFAIEVDLSMKPHLRYDRSMYFFDAHHSRTDIVFWLVDGISVMNGIFSRLVAGKIQRLDIHHFVLLSDFKKWGWDAIARTGQYSMQTVRNIYEARGWKAPATTPERGRQEEVHDLFLSIKKSPWVSKS